MYQAYWGLGESPFRANFDPRFFHQGPAQDEALARLHFLVDERRTLGLLLGSAGSGKSQLLDLFARQLGRVEREVALVNVAAIDLRQFLWLLATQLGVEAAGASTEFRLGRAVADHMLANRYQQIATVLLADDADLAQADVLNQIVRLAQLDASNQSGPTIVLSAQAERLHRLGNRLVEISDLRIDLEGWEADDTAAFVKKALSEAGRSTPVFSEPALRRLHELSGGIPRRVKQLADLALLAGAGDSLAQIEVDCVDSVCRELGAVVPAAMAASRSGNR
ncbi:MAG TPA: AAA family ATPase [Pirellulales bacterium]|nr:AAA family ATPase [Pirellulales bacterium]